MILCERCKAKPASYHSIKKINGVSTEQHLCDECRMKMLNSGVSQQDIGSLFSGFTSLFDTPRRTVLRCSKCGTTSDEFIKSGCVGCADCYKELEQIVLPVIKRVQGGLTHSGKSLQQNSQGDEISRLVQQYEQEISKAVAVEDYERAIELRNKIAKLKNN